MSIASEIQRIQNGVNNLKTALTNAGYTIPNGTKIDGFAAIVENGGSGSGSGNTGGSLPTWNITIKTETAEPDTVLVIYPVLENNDIVFKTAVIDLMMPGGKTEFTIIGTTFFMDYSIMHSGDIYTKTSIPFQFMNGDLVQYTITADSNLYPNGINIII